MYGITKESIIFYLLVWSTSFLAAFFRAVRDSNWNNIGNGISIGCTSGMFAFGIVCFLVDADSNIGTRGWFYVGCSALFGLLAKEQDSFAKAVVSRVLLAAKVVLADVKTEQPEEPEQEKKDE